MGRFEIPADGNPASFLNSLITAMSTGAGGLPGAIHHRGGTLQIQINNSGLGPMPRDLEQLLMRTSPGRRSGIDAARPNRDDPSSAVLFTPALTMARWAEESRILFGLGAQDRALRIVNSILRLLVPPAIDELKRKQKEEAERLQKLEEEREKARKEKEEQERKEREEEDARKKKEEEERQAAEAEAAARASEEPQDEHMEGVEATESAASEAPAEPEASAAEPAQRITTMIDGREIDITNLGIDPDYLAALPEDMRQEVIMEQTLAQRQTSNDTSGEQQDLDPEFLQALPPEMRDELMQQIAHERRRNEREASRRRNATAGAPPRADDMDPASFFATLDPALRSQLLMEVDEEALGALPPQLQAEARQLTGHHRRLDHYEHVNNLSGRDGGPRGMRGVEGSGDSVQKRKPTTYAQILDKAGVATLLRLMFIQQSSSIRNSLNGILRDVCHNKQNRAEVVSILLSILQDGSNDIGAVERSFSLLSLRAKQPSSAQKTPQPKRATPEFGTGVGEMSPITVVQQCLVCLEALVQHNPRIAEFFLTEHETGTGFKPKSARKGKGKESKVSRYPINALLGLLDRKIIIESAPVMELLASLLQRITHPLLVLLRKEKQDKEKAAEEEKKAQQIEAEATPAEATSQPTSGADIVMASPEQPVAPASEVTEPTAGASAEQKPEDKSKKRTLTPPDVPEYNLRLIINIIAARECPSKTFKDTLSLITNLSAIPEAKEIFGQELISQAQGLGRNILEDLQELEGQIRKASNGADVQGMALAKFSPASSDQAKLLRVITALDFLFDPKRAETQDKPSTSDAQSLGLQQKEDILTTLYENRIFVDLWDKLSLCLKEIHERENMFSVANILLPLIEVLMVVCKNTTLKDAPIKNTQQDFSVSSPEPESKEQRMESLFFRFTEDHRRILNELVRHNPKLMSGSFSLLVKNSKVLEFDNKRNYFTRRLHSRGQEVRQPHPSLQLSVRRDQVFLDSFKHLYYKKPDEFKYGKLSIRFAGEEGVDAGGVTREWFQALTKQMFDPNYALFVPVAADRTTFHPNSESAINEQHLTFFKFIGRIIGKALYEGRVLDCHFSRAVYKRILGRTISIKDMESLDNDYAKNLQWILDNDITDLITETFSVSTDVFGEEKVVDLIENGRDIEVTEDNKHEYVQRVVEYKLIGSVKEQMEHFLQGKQYNPLLSDLTNVW
jgi:E3 ubiquitin-protein ligase HUWE1